MHILRKASTKLVLARPDTEEPYYRGTRFDRSGIILSLESEGHSYISQWFRRYDPYMHDAVGGPAEEFTQNGYRRDAQGLPFLKPGVGVLRSKDEEYDRFHLYDIIDEGKRECSYGEDSAIFSQLINSYGWAYHYEKKVSIPEDGCLVLEHRLCNCGEKAIDTYVYNHNFFVLDGAFTGKDTIFDFPFRPQGKWRADYDCVALSDSGIRFSRDLGEGESVFMGDLNAGAVVKGWSFILTNTRNGLRVEAVSDADMEYAVFWSNHEVSCIEPYTHIILPPGERCEWKITYRFSRI